MLINRTRILLLTLITCSFFLIANPARAETRLMVLLDASGTMAAPGEPGTANTRFDEVRSALTAMLQALPADVLVGLRVMGGTPAADCYSSYLHFTPAQGMRSWFQDHVAAIYPAGSRALYQGIDDSLTDLHDRAPGVDRILLVITDGGDDCGRDFDTLALVYRNQPRIPRVVIYGLDLPNSTRESLGEFVAELGGRIRSMDSTADLHDALTALAAEFSNNLRIHLQDSSGMGVKGDLIVRNASTGAVIVEALDTADFSTDVPLGAYEVVGRYLGQEVRSERFTIGAGESVSISLTFLVYLETFTVTLRDLYGNALRARATFLNSLDEPVLTTELDSIHRVQLPPDNYSIEIRIGDRVVTIHGVLIGPGYEPVRDIEIPVELGVLEVEVYNLDGLPLNARVRIFDLDGTLVDHAPFASYLYSRLPPGTYRATAEIADVETEQTVHLYEGEERRVPLEINVPVGDLFVRLRTESGYDVWGRVQVYDSAGNLIQRFDPERMEGPDWFITNIAVGLYRVEAEAENIVRVVSGVEVRRDEETEITIEFPDEVY